MINVVIIGGGIAGLSCATILCEIPNVKITIYEKEYQIGGQACSEYNGKCFTEYSWRIFGESYYNLLYIFNKLKIMDNFEYLNKHCFIEGSDSSSAKFSLYNQMSKILKYVKINELYKYSDIFLQCKERLINDYRNVNANNYYNNNPIIQSIIGPFLGMETYKVSLSGALKNIYSVADNKKYDFLPKTSLITKYPTQQSIFDTWSKYLKNKGVSIILNHTLENIHIKDNKIKYITVNNENIYANEYVFACSIKPIINIIKTNRYNISTFNKIVKMEKDLQLYFTINIYFSEKLNESDECKEIVIVDMPWKPIIQKKRTWGEKYLKYCNINNRKIKDVWNVGFLDYVPGLYNKKILSDCSIKEAITEGILQVKNSEYIKKLLHEKNKKFDDIYIGYDYWNQFIENKNGKIISENPKFSINVDTMNNMPITHNNDLPTNMLFAGYYVNSSMGGVSMEASCETGLNAGKYIIDKYKLPYNDILPIKHQNENLSSLFIPFTILDKYLYKNKLSPITHYVNSVILVIFYFIFIIILLLYIIFTIINKIYKK